jgi:long-chain acyl-CoA synthetase
MLLYTSGTTGAAKGVCITHESLGMHTQALVEETLQLTEEDRILGTLPLSHSYGIRMTLLAPFFAGASTVFVPRFSPSRTLELCAAHQITWLPGVPTMFVAWADETTQQTPPSLRWCMSAGAPLAEDVRLRAEQRLGAPVRQGYGLTEATFTAINAPPDDAVPGSCGKPVAGVELRIADDFGEELPIGAHGEVLIRGQNVMAGYLDERLATAHVMRGGWLHTGDIGFVDDEGRLTIADRSKDLILRGGASIYPSEVENALAHHAAVREVAVVGQPDDYYGEEIVAVVVRTADVTALELDAWAREQLAPYKVPRRFAFVDSLPQGVSGKTLKRLLRDQLASGEISAEELAAHGSAD